MVSLYNPKNGADIKVDEIELDFKTDTFIETDERTAKYLLSTFGFLQEKAMPPKKKRKPAKKEKKVEEKVEEETPTEEKPVKPKKKETQEEKPE